MLSKHLTEADIQQYAANKEKCPAEMISHITACASCRDKVNLYERMFSVIKREAIPDPGFDLAAGVLMQLPPAQISKKSERPVLIIVAVMVLLLAAVTGFLFREYLARLFAGMSTLIIYLTLFTAVTITGASLFDMYLMYRKKIKQLDFIH